MIGGTINNNNQAEGQGKFGNDRGKNLSKLAASAFLSKPKYEDDANEPEGLGNLLDQRRINEIFVRLKVFELILMFFAVFGIGCGVIDYEISYYDTSENSKDTRIILE